MTSQLEEIRKLSIGKRIELINVILDSIKTETNHDDNWEFDDQTKRELDEQLKRHAEGKSKNYTWEEVKNRIMRKKQSMNLSSKKKRVMTSRKSISTMKLKEKA